MSADGIRILENTFQINYKNQSSEMPNSRILLVSTNMIILHFFLRQKSYKIPDLLNNSIESLFMTFA